MNEQTIQTPVDNFLEIEEPRYFIDGRMPEPDDVVEIVCTGHRVVDGKLRLAFGLRVRDQ